MSLQLYAGMRVRDFAAARAWYEQLLGEASLLPHVTEAVWTLAEDRSVYIEQDADRAGQVLSAPVKTIWHGAQLTASRSSCCRRACASGCRRTIWRGL